MQWRWPLCGRSDFKLSIRLGRYSDRGQSEGGRVISRGNGHFIKGCFIWPLDLGLVTSHRVNNVWSHDLKSSHHTCLIIHKLLREYFLKRRSLFLIPSLPFSLPEILGCICQATKAVGRGVTERKQCILVLDDCWLPSPICSLLQSLTPSLPPPFSNLHCTERSMWRRIVNVPSFVNVCFRKKGKQCRRGDRNYKRERLQRSPVCLLYVCFWVCMYVCARCNAEQGKSLPQPPPRWDYVVLGAALRLRERGVGSGLQRVGWRAGAAGSRGRSAPSATRAAWVNSTRVSTAMAKAITQEHGAVTLLSIRPTTKPSSSRWLLCTVMWEVAVIPSSICHLSPWMLIFSAASLNNAASRAVKRAVCHLSCTPHRMQSPSLLSPVLLSLRLISPLFFAPAPPHICIWISQSLPGLCVFCWQRASVFTSETPKHGMLYTRGARSCPQSANVASFPCNVAGCWGQWLIICPLSTYKQYCITCCPDRKGFCTEQIDILLQLMAV